MGSKAAPAKRLKKIRSSGSYITPGIDAQFLLRMEEPILQNARKVCDEVYGGRPKPPESRWLAYLIAIGADRAKEMFANGGAPIA